MCKTADVIGKKAKGIEKKKALPQWTEDCRMAIRVRNRLLRKVRKTFSFDDFILYKRAKGRKVVRTEKKK